MHFSKTYSQLLLSLPPELRENAIEYRQLKKLINQVVHELNSLGFDPAILSTLLAATRPGELIDNGNKASPILPPTLSKIVYELHRNDSDKIEPRLKLWMNKLPSTSVVSQSEGRFGSATSSVSSLADMDASVDGNDGLKLLYSLQSGRLKDGDPPIPADEIMTEQPSGAHIDIISSNTETNEQGDQIITIPLSSDAAFFQLLSTAINSMTNHMQTIQSEFTSSLEDLSKNIAQTARTASEVSSSHHTSLSKLPPFREQSDLNTWRSIFQLYINTEVFEGVSEISRGEHSIEDSERRLQLFADEVTKRGHNKLKLKQSKAALEKFLQVNLFILNVKKYQYGNAEATRKILKKHAKRTALPYPTHFLSASPSSTATTHPDFSISILPSPPTSLVRTLVQAVGETLLPIIPHIDDYSCLICMQLAFKPIRLQCGHLFCVRCLVKMQKRGQNHCPMCRAPTVLVANRSNVDWAMLHFMEDWFPVESRKKRKQNEKEATDEELRELGLDPDQNCVIA